MKVMSDRPHGAHSYLSEWYEGRKGRKEQGPCQNGGRQFLILNDLGTTLKAG